MCLRSDEIADDIIATEFSGAAGELIRVGDEEEVYVCVCHSGVLMLLSIG